MDEDVGRYLVGGRRDVSASGWSTRSRSASPAANHASHLIQVSPQSLLYTLSLSLSVSLSSALFHHFNDDEAAT